MREISAADHATPDACPPGSTEPTAAPAGQGTTIRKNATAMSRRSKRAVRTVTFSDYGRAACTDHMKLFEIVEGTDDEAVTYQDRLDAAAVCGGCPLRSRCGFRVRPSGSRRKADR